MAAKSLKRGKSTQTSVETDDTGKTKIIVDKSKLENKPGAPKKLPSPGSKTTVWNNKNLDKIKTIEVEIPISLIYVMREIQRKMTSNSEFGLYLKGRFENKKLIVSDEYYIPKQTVSGASIDFDDDDGGPEWNGVIHKHPSGCTGFSGTDDGSINSNHLFSLLFESGQIKSGEINLTVKEILGRIRVPLDLTFRHPEINVPDELIKKINDRPQHYNPYQYNPNYGYGFRGGNYQQRHGNWWDSLEDEHDRVPTIAHGTPGQNYKTNAATKGNYRKDNNNRPKIKSEDPSDVATRNTERLKKVFGEDFDPNTLSDWDRFDMFSADKQEDGEVGEETGKLDLAGQTEIDAD